MAAPGAEEARRLTVAPDPMAGVPDDGYLIEFIQIGNAVKVSAVDPRTGIEVSIVGSPLMSRREMSRTAVQKLEYRIAKLQK